MESSRINLFSRIERAGGRPPLYRIPIDLSLGCPNRGVDGSGGCTFCPADGARAVQLSDASGIHDQITRGIAFAKRRYKTTRFVAYIQAYTGTLQEVGRQRETYAAILREYDFEALAIGTRPDSLSDEAIELLQELDRSIPIWVELGVQTSCDRTLVALNRGHDWASSRDAIQRLHAAGLTCIAHVMLGLPDEGQPEMDATASALAALPVHGIKLHNLHIIAGTALAEQYAATPFPLLDEQGYAEAVIRFLRRTPRETLIHRLTTDTPEPSLLAPRWSLAKGQFITYLDRLMERRAVWQGDLIPRQPPLPSPRVQAEGVVRLESSSDGATSALIGDMGHYLHPPYGAALSARERYARPTLERHDGERLRVLDVGFGLGLNSLELLRACADAPHSPMLEITGIEHDRRPALLAGEETAACFPSPPPPLPDWNAVLAALADGQSLAGDWGSLKVEWGDARHLVRSLDDKFDVIWLDGFKPAISPELWSAEFLQLLHDHLAPGGFLLTHERSITVIGGLLAARWQVHRYPTPHGEGLVASDEEQAAGALSPALLQRVMHTPGGYPLHDPSLAWLPHTIIQARKQALDVRTIVP